MRVIHPVMGRDVEQLMPMGHGFNLNHGDFRVKYRPVDAPYAGAPRRLILPNLGRPHSLTRSGTAAAAAVN